MKTLGNRAQLEIYVWKERVDVIADRAKVVLNAHIDQFNEVASLIIDQNIGRADGAPADIEPVVRGRGRVGDLGLGNRNPRKWTVDSDRRGAIYNNGQVALQRRGACRHSLRQGRLGRMRRCGCRARYREREHGYRNR